MRRVSASAPVRIDLAGGWTDVAPYTDENPGEVVNIAIDKRAHAELLVDDDGMLSVGQAQALIESAVDECDRFYPAFQFALWGNKSPADALEAAMIDAAGEA